MAAPASPAPRSQSLLAGVRSSLGNAPGFAKLSFVGCEIHTLEGANGELKAISWRDRKSGTETRRAVRYLFSFIGAEPNTDWLKPCGISLDPKGFVLTNTEIGKRPLETAIPGIFAIGDVRSGSVKRVASAVGEGAQVVATLHTYLAAPHETAAAVS